MAVVNYNNDEKMIVKRSCFLIPRFSPSFEDLFIVYVNDNGEIVITTKDKTNDNMKNLFMNEVAKK